MSRSSPPHILLALALAMIIGTACSSSGVTPAPGSPDPTFSSSPSPTASPTEEPEESVDSSPTTAAVASPDRSACPDGTLSHDAPELEELLPATVAGRPMTIWSTAGWCWVGIVFPGDVEFATIAAPISELEIDVGDLAYGVAGRTEDGDPPYFVNVMSRPSDLNAEDVAIFLMVSGLGTFDPEAFIDGEGLRIAEVGGKEVQIGSADMVPQDDHQRGVPYIYSTAEHIYLVLTDDPAWAEDAIRQLP